MTLIDDKQQQSPSRANGSGALRLAPVARERNVPWMVLGVFLIAGGALLFVLLAGRLDDRQPVLAMRRAVPAGQVIREIDLKVVKLSVDGSLSGLPSSMREEVVGKPAATDLAADTLLTRASVGTGEGLSPGKAVIGLALKPGQLPSDDVVSGSRVVVLDTGESTGGGRAEPEAISEGRVTGVREHESGIGAGTIAVSVVVDEDQAPRIAAANAAGRIALVLVSA
jgi:hypothetical protein